MHITNKTETEDEIFEFTLFHDGIYRNSFHQILVYILRGKDGFDFAEIDIVQRITRTGNFKEYKTSQWYIEGPWCEYDGHYCHDADGHHYDPPPCKRCNRYLSTQTHQRNLH